jgi:polysaccharide biosynthesis transport protein
MGLRSIVRTLWRRKWMLVIVPLSTMLVVFVIRYFGDWQYTSTAQLSTGITANGKLADRDDRLAPDEMEIEFNNLIEVIKSSVVINQVSYRLLQHDIPTSSFSFRRPSEGKIRDELGINLLANEDLFRHILDKKLDNLSSLDAISEDERLLQSVIELYGYDAESLLDHFRVSRIGNTDYLELKFTSEDPDLSAFAVNEICSELSRYYTHLQEGQSSISIESLAETAIQRKDDLDDKLSRLQAFRSNNEIVNSDVESISKISQIKSYEDQIAAEQQKQRSLELTQASLNIRIQDAEGGATGRPNDEVVKIRRKITAFNEKYVTGGQTDQQLLDSITALRGKLDEVLKRIEQAPKYTPAELKSLKERRDQTQVDLQISRENLTALNRKLNALHYNMGDFANKEAKRKLLEDEVELAREEYLTAQNRFAEAKQKLNANKLAIDQVMYGEPASKPQTRGAIILVGGSGAVSFLLCALFILVREFSDSRIRTANRLKATAKIPVVGIIPELSRAVRNPSWSFFLDAQSTELARLNDYFRKIRFSVDSYKAQILLVTSTQKEQGKTFVVMALAYTFSLAKKRTLIIDTNLRHNSLTRSLTARVNLKQSIESYNSAVKQLTAGEGDVKKELTATDGGNLISHTYNEFVDVIGNKTSHLSPSEVIPVKDFKVLLNWLRDRYDYIILEGASLNEFSDSRELTHFVDIVLPVFSAETSLTDDDKDSLHFLHGLNGKLGPGILNRVTYEEKGMAAAL